MESELLSLFSCLCLMLLTGVSCEDLIPLNNEEFSLEDSSITLSYRYSKEADLRDYFFWYRQYPGEPPELLIYHTISSAPSSPRPGWSFSVREGNTVMDLQISSAALSDSAVYYCAVRLNNNANKLIFGRGTRLIVEPKTHVDPSFYKLDSDDESVCLATGFTNHTVVNETARSLFDGTEAVRGKGESGYSQVASLTKDKEKEKCEELEPETLCAEPLKPDPLVNLMSLTVVGLRLIFIKTIIFNVLMTLRLWISH